jgi:hypothetical protein
MVVTLKAKRGSMGIEATMHSEMASIDEETLRWLLEFSTWKRRKAERPEDIHIRFLLEYMAQRVYDYYFIHRNYTHLVSLLEAYTRQFGEADGLTRLIKDLEAHLAGD